MYKVGCKTTFQKRATVCPHECHSEETAICPQQHSFLSSKAAFDFVGSNFISVVKCQGSQRLVNGERPLVKDHGGPIASLSQQTTTSFLHKTGRSTRGDQGYIPLGDSSKSKRVLSTSSDHIKGRRDVNTHREMELVKHRREGRRRARRRTHERPVCDMGRFRVND